MTATVRITLSETRILVRDPSGDRLVARLPPLRASHRWALKSLLESLALWSRQRLRVVLYADDSCDWERLGLTDALGFEDDGLHLDIEIVPHQAQRRGRCLAGLGSFARERNLLRKVGA